jgi:hypothetical protein
MNDDESSNRMNLPSLACLRRLPFSLSLLCMFRTCWIEEKIYRLGFFTAFIKTTTTVFVFFTALLTRHFVVRFAETKESLRHNILLFLTKKKKLKKKYLYQQPSLITPDKQQTKFSKMSSSNNNKKRSDEYDKMSRLTDEDKEMLGHVSMDKINVLERTMVRCC